MVPEKVFNELQFYCLEHVWARSTAIFLCHCSAGVGRTGCYIVLDAMMRQIASRGDVNVFSYLKHIRRQRNHLVQTEEQYIFIHDALAEAVEGGETHIGKGCLPRYIHSLQCVDVTDEKSHSNKLLERQYRVSEQMGRWCLSACMILRK